MAKGVRMFGARTIEWLKNKEYNDEVFEKKNRPKTAGKVFANGAKSLRARGYSRIKRSRRLSSKNLLNAIHTKSPQVTLFSRTLCYVL